MKTRALFSTLLAAVAAVAMGFAAPVSHRATGEGTMSFGHDEEGRGLLRFTVVRDDAISGTLLFAAEDHHERFPDVVVRLGTFDEATFGARWVTFSGPGHLHDDPVHVAVTARDRATGDRFEIKCTDATGAVVFEASGTLFRGDIRIDSADESGEVRR